MSSWAELRRYARKHGLLLRVSDHEYYLLTHPLTGERAILKVPLGQGEIPSNLWKRILQRQLQLSQEDFNRLK